MTQMITTTFELDPFSDAYSQKLQRELRLDSAAYTHVDTTVLNQFDTLLQKYPHVFILPSAPP